MKHRTIIKLTKTELESVGAFTSFYMLVAKKLGITDSPRTRFNCAKICVAQNIQDAWFVHYTSRGFSPAQIAMQLCISSAKVDKTLRDFEVAVEDGFICEEYSIEEVIKDLLGENNEKKLITVCQDIRRNLNEVDTSNPGYGRDILRAYLNNDVHELFRTLTGQDICYTLQRAGIIQDTTIIC